MLFSGCIWVTKCAIIIGSLGGIMAIKNTSFVPGKPKKSRQGTGKNTKYAATSRNNAKKRYRGQG